MTSIIEKLVTIAFFILAGWYFTGGPSNVIRKVQQSRASMWKELEWKNPNQHIALG